jgi:imidazolonepropionase-like amidohydrolase
VSGTLTASQVMGLDQEIGTAEPGTYADLVAVLDDPFQDISTLQRVVFVMQGGQVVIET